MTGRVAVVGAGIGGLSCAIMLHQTGQPVTVLERAPEVADLGVGLSIWPAALRALDVLGLGKRVRELGEQPSNLELRRSTGQWLLRGSAGPMVLIGRDELIRLLADALPDGIVRTGVAVRDPATLLAKHVAVIGADGIHSIVRDRLLPGPSRARCSGVTAWRGVIPGTVPASMEILGRGKKFGVTRFAGGRTYFYAATGSERTVPSDGCAAELRACFAGWADPVPWVLDRLDGVNILRHTIQYVDPPLRGYAHGRVAVLGDAAHAMPPDLGQGACQALRDGVTLGACLALADDPAAALGRYDRLRRRPSQRVAKASRWVEQLTTGDRLFGC